MEINISDPIIILDPNMETNGVRIVKSASEIFGFNIKNESGQILFIEGVFDYPTSASEHKILKEIIIRK